MITHHGMPRCRISKAYSRREYVMPEYGEVIGTRKWFAARDKQTLIHLKFHYGVWLIW